jgi:hypothetical protein
LIVGVSVVDELDQREYTLRLAALRTEHGDLDASINALINIGTGDQIMMMRLKKRKLRLRDEIQMIESRLVPDIIA